MPVTKTATRALRVSKRKTLVNKKLTVEIEIAIRSAKKSRKEADVKKSISLIDRAVKKNMLHKNKAARMKSSLVRQVEAKKTVSVPTKKKAAKKSTKKSSK